MPDRTVRRARKVLRMPSFSSFFFIDASRCLDQKTQTKVGGLPRTIEMEIRRHLYMHREQSKSAPEDQATTSRMARIHRLGSRAAR